MISRSATTRRRSARQLAGHLAALGVVFGFASTMLVATAASAAPNPGPSGSTKAVVRSITVTGPANKKQLAFRADQQPDQYNALLNEVSWMNDHNPDIFMSTPTDLGAHYVVTVFEGSKVTARYDLYPDVKGGPRARREQVGSTKAAWFFAPIDMSATLAAVGVKLPSSVATDGVLTNRPKSTPLMSSISGIFRQSVTALALAGLGCLAILVLLGAAARRSRAVDRRRTVPPAITRLNTAKAKAAAGPGAAVRPAVPSGRWPVSLAGRPFAARVAAITRRTTSAPAPVSPPGVAPASAPVAVTRPRTVAGAQAIGTPAKAPTKSWRNWMPVKSRTASAPRASAPSVTAPVGAARVGTAPAGAAGVGAAPAGAAPVGAKTGLIAGASERTSNAASPSAADAPVEAASSAPTSDAEVSAASVEALTTPMTAGGTVSTPEPVPLAIPAQGKSSALAPAALANVPNQRPGAAIITHSTGPNDPAPVTGDSPAVEPAATAAQVGPPPVAEPAPVSESEVVTEPTPIAKPAATVAPTVVTKSDAATEPTVVGKPAVIATPTIVAKPAVIADPVAVAGPPVVIEPVVVAGPDKPGGPGSLFQPVPRPTPPVQAAKEPTQRVDEPTVVVKAPTETLDGPTEVVKSPTLDGPSGVVNAPTLDEPTEVVKAPTLDEPTEVVKRAAQTLDGPTEVVKAPSLDRPSEVVKAPTLDEPTEVVKRAAQTLDGPTEVVKAPSLDRPSEVVKAPTLDEPTEVVKRAAQTLDGPTEVVKAPTLDEPTEVVKAPTLDEPTEVVKRAAQTLDGPTEVVKAAVPDAPADDAPTKSGAPAIEPKAPDQRRGGTTSRRSAKPAARSDKVDG